jgi:hypothetical protein
LVAFAGQGAQLVDAEGNITVKSPPPKPTWRSIGTLLDRFKPEECANYLVNAGYASA